MQEQDVDIATRVLRERADRLTPKIAESLQGAIQAVEQLLHLIDERESHARVLDSLGGRSETRTGPHPSNSRTGVPTPDRVRRLHRELLMMESRDQLANSNQRHEPSMQRLRRSKPVLPRGGQKADVLQLAESLAVKNSGQVTLVELAKVVMNADPGRYSTVVSARASLHSHLARSDKFEKVATGTFRAIAGQSLLQEEGGSIE